MERRASDEAGKPALAIHPLRSSAGLWHRPTRWCSEVRIRQQCLNLRTPTVEQQQGAYAEMVAHPELKNVRIQAADLDYALRENAACWGETSHSSIPPQNPPQHD